MGLCVQMWKCSSGLLVLLTMLLLATIILIGSRQVQLASDDEHAEQKQ